MNSKGLMAIIGTIVVVGVVVIGSVYFMTSKPATAATTATSSLVSPNNTTSSNSNLNNQNTQTKNNSAQASNNQSNNLNEADNHQNTNPKTNQKTNQNNENNNINKQNTHSDVQVNNPQPKAQSKAQPAPKPVISNNGTGDFADILNGSNYMSGVIDGTQITIPLQGGHVVNNLLILPEYYVNRLNETFTAKIASLGNGNFKLYEYYGNQNTAIFDLKAHTTEGMTTLSGSFTHSGTNAVTGITFNLINSNFGSFVKMPFYNTTINGTPVTIIPKVQSNGFYEKYAGDNNLFNLSYDFQAQNNNGQIVHNGQTYNVLLKESYNGQTTGEYYLKSTPNSTNYSGIFVTKPGTSQSQTYNVTLTGSLTPEQ